MKRRSFLKGLIGLSAVSIAGCMRPPSAKVMPAILDCETAMSDAPACSKPPINATEIRSRIEEMYGKANVREEITYIPQQTSYLLNGHYEIEGKDGKWNAPEYYDGSTEGLLVARKDMKEQIVNRLIINGLYNG